MTPFSPYLIIAIFLFATMALGDPCKICKYRERPLKYGDSVKDGPAFCQDMVVAGMTQSKYVDVYMPPKKKDASYETWCKISYTGPDNPACAPVPIQWTYTVNGDTHKGPANIAFFDSKLNPDCSGW